MDVNAIAISDDFGNYRLSVTLTPESKISELDLSFFECNTVLECVNCNPEIRRTTQQSCSSVTFNNLPTGDYEIYTTVFSSCGEEYRLETSLQVGKCPITSIVLHA